MDDGDTFDPYKTPFSRYGAYVALSPNEDGSALVLHNVQRPPGQDREYTIGFSRAGRAVAWTATATPWELTVEAPEGRARFVVISDDRIAVMAEGLEVSIRLVQVYGYGSEEDHGRFKIICAATQFTGEIHVVRGTGRFEGPTMQFASNPAIDRRLFLRVSPLDGSSLAVIRLTQAEVPPAPLALDFDRERAVVRDEWRRFHQRMPPVADAHRATASTACYTLWSCYVRAKGACAYDSMLMSKKRMCAVWAWDHCFNALAMSRLDRRMGLEQFLLPFVLQAANGALPDRWNCSGEATWGITKPPVHGWCFGKLMEEHEFDRGTLLRVGDHLERLTRWWLTCRDSDGDGIPDYPQGCDSGWDNSTLFERGFYLESPDLPALLVLQMHTLAEISRRLGDPAGRERWTAEADALLQRLYAHSWQGDRFVARQSRSHETPEPQTSLLSLIPLVLGEHLDPGRFAGMAAILERDFLTEHGLATEMPSSPLYEANGYWRGPIWAPSTYLLVDGLRRGGRGDLAAEIARRFYAMIGRQAGGNFENFDARTGQGLCAPGYTWTASVNLLLLWDYSLAAPGGAAAHPDRATRETTREPSPCPQPHR